MKDEKDSGGKNYKETTDKSFSKNITPAKFKVTIIQHANWLDSGGERGTKANLSNLDLSNCVLEYNNLSEANFENSDLSRWDLNKVNLSRTRLFGCILHDAKLTKATGLISSQLAGADLARASLPIDIREFMALDQAEAIAKICKKIYMAMLLLCLFSWITIGGTTDVALLCNSNTSHLPIIGVNIPIVGFFIMGPLLLLGIYIYFHIYLQRLWETLYSLPAFFPDGRPLDKTVYPWFMISLTRSHIKFLKLYPPPLTKLRTLISIILAWWIIPITHCFFWFRYLTRHHWLISAIHILILCLSVFIGYLTYRIATGTLKGKPWKTIISKKAISANGGVLGMLKADKRIWQLTTIVGVSLVFFWGCSFAVINGKPPSYGDGPTTWMSRIWSSVGYNIFADFTDQPVSDRPEYWWTVNEDIIMVPGANLKGSDIRFLEGENTYLVNAKLNNSNLFGANLLQADMQFANFTNANLRSAVLTEATMKHCIFINADLSGAILKKAKLNDADFSNATLVGANFDNADLSSVNMTGANLDSASLRNTVLSRTQFKDASMFKTDLRGTDLTNALDLTARQLQDAIFDTLTIFPGELREVKLKFQADLASRK